MRTLVLLLAWLSAGLSWAQTAVGEAAIRQAVEKHVRAALEGKTQERFAVHARWKGDVLIDGTGPVEIAVRPLSSRPFRGPGLVRVELKSGGQTRRSLTVTVDTHFYRQVLVASRAIRRGEMFTGESVALEERDITRQKNGVFTDPAQVQGQRARRTVGAGEIISRQHSEAVPVVKQGDPVLLVVDSGPIQLSVQGTSLQDGGVGARIRVRNQDSGKILEGQVVDARTVRMGLEGQDE